MCMHKYSIVYNMFCMQVFFVVGSIVTRLTICNGKLEYLCHLSIKLSMFNLVNCLAH